MCDTAPEFRKGCVRQQASVVTLEPRKALSSHLRSEHKLFAIWRQSKLQAEYLKAIDYFYIKQGDVSPPPAAYMGDGPAI